MFTVMCTDESIESVDCKPENCQTECECAKCHIPEAVFLSSSLTTNPAPLISSSPFF